MMKPGMDAAPKADNVGQLVRSYISARVAGCRAALWLSAKNTHRWCWSSRVQNTIWAWGFSITVSAHGSNKRVPDSLQSWARLRHWKRSGANLGYFVVGNSWLFRRHYLTVHNDYFLLAAVSNCLYPSNHQNITGGSWADINWSAGARWWCWRWEERYLLVRFLNRNGLRNHTGH